MNNRHAVVTGRVLDEGSGRVGIPGVSVSDGLSVVSTDSTGRYRLTVDPSRRKTTLVHITVPAGWRAPQNEYGTPSFWRKVDVTAGARADVDFRLLPDASSRRDEFRFIALADVHVNVGGLNPKEWFTRQLQQIERLAEESGGDDGLPAFIAVAGDLTNGASAQEFSDYRAAIATSSIPVWSAPGNHDLTGRPFTGPYPKPWPNLPYLDLVEGYRQAIGPEWYSFQYGSQHFVILENYKGLSQADQLRWLERDLTAHADGRQIVVITHVPWNVPQTPAPTEASPYLDLLADYDVQLLLAGHTHSNDVSTGVVGGAQQIVTTTSSAATLDETPQGFRVVGFRDGGVEAPFRELDAHRRPTIVYPVDAVPWLPDNVQVTRYSPPGVPTEVEYRVEGQSWQPLQLLGRRTWIADFDLDGGTDGKPQQLDIRVRDDERQKWAGTTSTFEVTGEERPRPRQGTPWSMFRGDVQRRGVAADKVSPPLTLGWVRHLGGTILSSSPAIAHGMVYIGVRDEDATTANGVAAIDLASGEPRWFTPTNGAVESSPAVADDLVIVPSVRGPLRAIDAATGDVRWEWAPGGAAPEAAWMYFSPVISDRIIYQAYCVRSGIWVAGLDVRSGELRWRTSEPAGRNWTARAAPAVTSDSVYFATAYANLVATDANTGDLRWQTALDAGLATRATPLVADGLVVLACQGDLLAAVDADTGVPRWRYRSGGPSLLPGAGTAASPALAHDMIYAGFTDGCVAAVSLETGERVWQHDTDGPVLSSPAVSGDVLYVGSHDGRLRALACATGECLWQYDVGAWIASSPGVTGNSVVVGAWDGNVYAFTAP